MSLPWIWKYGQNGMLLGILFGANMMNWRTFTLRWPFSPRYTLVLEPRNVEHILKLKFENYVKGAFLHDILCDLLGDGIFTVDGALWHTQRKVATQLFSYRNFRDNIMRVFHAHGREVMAILDAAAGAGTPVDMHALFHRFTLDAIAEIAFGTSIHSLQDPQHVFAVSFDNAQQIIDHRVYMPGWKLFRYLLPREYALRRSIAVMDKYCAEMIAERRAAGDYESRPDVLSRFMSMKDDTTGEPLYLHNDKYLRDVIMNFMIAGRDTTAQALSWCLHCTMQHPKVEAGIVHEAHALLRAERASEGPGESFEPTYDEVLHDLKYTLAVVQETLRLYPSVPKDTKMAVESDTLPDGTFVPAGTFVAYLPHAQGRNTSVWGDDAADFKPERFMTGEKYSPFKFISFNAGPRTCLGQHMALVEATYLTALLQTRYRFELVAGHVVEPADSLTLPMKHGLRVHVHRR